MMELLRQNQQIPTLNAFETKATFRLICLFSLLLLLSFDGFLRVARGWESCEKHSAQLFGGFSSKLFFASFPEGECVREHLMKY